MKGLMALLAALALTEAGARRTRPRPKPAAGCAPLGRDPLGRDNPVGGRGVFAFFAAELLL